MSSPDTTTDKVEPKSKNHKKYRREKPWDDDPTLNKWEIQPWDATTGDTLPGGSLLEESSFATLFPKYREKYLREAWPLITKALDLHGIACELNLVEGSMTVRTTRKTKDPYIIMKARDVIKLLSRSIPATQAVKILNDEMQCDIIKIGGLVRNKDRFVRRRQRLLGPDGATLKALELLTGCYVLVQGNTVATMGKYWGLKEVRKVVLECMQNIHPVYNIKRLMIVRELRKDPKLANEDWSRFLPVFKKKTVKRRVPHQVVKEKEKRMEILEEKMKERKEPTNEGESKETTTTNTNTTKKKVYTPFPPPQLPSKIDKMLDSGEYFLKEHQRKRKKVQDTHARASIRSKEKRKEKEKIYEPPSSKVDVGDKDDMRKKDEGIDISDLGLLKSKFKSSGTKKKGSLSDFVEMKTNSGGEEVSTKTEKKKQKTVHFQE